MRAGTRIGVASTAVTLVLLLAGCADNTGAIDNEGHNGYDRMTCNDLKVLAMDVQYGALAPADRPDRVQQLRDEASKAADPVVRQSASTYLDALISGNRNQIATTITAFTKICRF